MASVKSTSSTLSATTGNMMTGLVSGMDTESMVEQLLSATQSKIDAQNAKKQQIEWKQEIYRDIIGKIDSFRTKFFSFSGTGNNNLLSNALYNTMSTSSSSSAVKVISSGSSAATNMNITSIKQLATSCKISTADGVAISKGLAGIVDQSSLSELAGKELSIQVSLDGVKKTVRFEGADTVEQLAENLNESLKNVFGDTIKVSADGGCLKFSEQKANDTSHTIILSNVSGENTLSKLGFSDGASNKISYTASLKDTPFATALEGDVFEFSINGTVIKASSSDTVGDVINRINSSEAGVRITYNSLSDKFVMESKSTGSISDIKLEQTQGNLLSTMFGIGQGSGTTGSISSLRETDTITAGAMDLDQLATVIDGANERGTSFALHVNGTAVSITIPKPAEGEDPYTEDTLIEAFNKQLDEKFGAGNIVLSKNAEGNMQIQSKDGYQISFTASDEKNGITSVFGFQEGQSQKVTAQTTLGAMGLSGTWQFSDGKSLTLDANMSMSEFVEKFNALGVGTMAFDENTGAVSISGISGELQIQGADATGKAAMSAIFGRESMSFNTSGLGLNVEAGKNAVLVVDGLEIERNSNEFELNGITMKLQSVTNEAVNLSSTRNTEGIVDTMKSFVEEYNKLIDELNGYISEESNYRSYAPLTDAQKKEMSEKEIELWEKKAKEGLLRNDSNISKLLSDMRSALYETVESAGISIYDIGLDISSDYKDNGKLTLNEEQLKNALATDPEKVQQLFTNKEQGIGQKLNQILKNNANISSGSPGILVSYAGMKTTLSTENTLSKQLSSISQRISELTTKYETERTRYWNMFTQMEKALSQLNTQSSWLTQRFSS